MASTDDLELAYYKSLFGAAASDGLTLPDLRYKYYYLAVRGELPGGGGGGGGWTAVDASPTVKGILQLAGDLGGTAEAPTVPGLAGKAPTVHTHTKSQITDFAHTHAAADVTSGVFPPARIATGTPDGTKFLRDDQVWAAPPSGGGGNIGATSAILGAVPGGGWLGGFERGNGGNNYLLTIVGQLLLTPVWLPHSLTTSHIGIAVTSAATAGGLARLGVYNSKADGMPGTVLFDAGTVGTDTTGVKLIATTQTLNKGLYYFAAVTLVAVATVRSEAAVGASRFGGDPYDQQFFDGTGLTNWGALQLAGVTGALPDLTGAALVGTQEGYRVGLKRA